MNPIVSDVLVAALAIYIVGAIPAAVLEEDAGGDIPSIFVSTVLWPLWFFRQVYRSFIAKWRQ